ncbi:MAG: FkbM family methyltransferase, partial [Deltaproteobacteria bacterium]|nr:FkbM family methyltransferase [Deltaproteobacteria bacterium]
MNNTQGRSLKTPILLAVTLVNFGIWAVFWSVERKPDFPTYYSQQGEDVVIESILSTLGIEDPNDIVLGVGVGVTSDKQADYYLIDGGLSQLNTFSAHFTQQGRTLDLLSIDVEGLDYAILQTLDFERYRPAVICAETVKVASVH